MAAILIGSALLSSKGAINLHKEYIYSKTAKRVVRLYGKMGGGTGFQISYRGKQYIVTNAHVCDAAGDDDFMTGRRDMEASGYHLSILARNFESDLCLLSPLPDLKGLELGRSVSARQEIMVVGHPRLNPLTITMGRITDIAEVSIPFHVPSEEICAARKGNWVTIQSFFGFPVNYCIKKHLALFSDAQIEPGNSGSPVVNFWGDVVAVVFAGGGGVSLFIPGDQLRSFLDNVQ